MPIVNYIAVIRISHLLIILLWSIQNGLSWKTEYITLDATGLLKYTFQFLQFYVLSPDGREWEYLGMRVVKELQKTGLNWCYCWK